MQALQQRAMMSATASTSALAGDRSGQGGTEGVDTSACYVRTPAEMQVRWRCVGCVGCVGGEHWLGST